MDKKTLIETAGMLKKVTPVSVKEYTEKIDFLVSSMNNILSSRKDILKIIGVDNLDMMFDNHANHARFMSSIFTVYVPEVFVETILWVFRAYRSHRFTTNYWATQLNVWIQIIKQNMSPKAAVEILPYYEWMQINIPLFVKLSDDKLDAEISRH